MKDNAENESRRPKGRGASIAIVALAVALAFVFVAVAIGQADTTVSQDGPLSAAWTTYFEETFESTLGPEWTISDLDGNANGEYYWARTNNLASGGSYSAWATGGGANGGSLEPGVDDYPNSAASVMVHDPVDLSGQTNARLTFDVWHKTQPSLDLLQVAVSTNGANYTPVAVYSGDSGGWSSKVLDLGAYAGNSSVYVRFYFSSDAATTDEGVYLDNIRLEAFETQVVNFPLIMLQPTPEPQFFYFDDFSDPNSGWPVVDNTWNPQDCFKWYYSNSQTYHNDICDDRTDVKVSPGVNLPVGDYVLEADGRFRQSNDMWWTSYGIMFDAKDEPDPNKPDLGDYYMVWVLWEGNNKHKWKIMQDKPGGKQEDVTSWSILDGAYYDYGNEGTNFNHWKVERTDSRIRVYVNGKKLADVGNARPTTNNQVWFGLYSSTYETTVMKAGYDNLLVDYLGADVGVDGPYWSSGDASESIIVSGQFELDNLLPDANAAPGPVD